MKEEGSAKGFKELEFRSHLEYNVEQQIKHLHDSLHPEIYFVTQTSAAGAGYMIREIYKTAWPNEPIPKILTIDPRALFTNIFNEGVKQEEFDKGEVDGSKEFRKLVSKTKNKLERIKNYGIKGNIAVIDEAFMVGSMGSGLKSSDTPKSWQIADRIVRVARGELGLKNDVAAGGFADTSRSFSGYWLRRDDDSKKYRHVTKRKVVYHDSWGKDVEATETELSGENVDRLKKFGREIGEQIKQEEQKRKSLEQQVASVIAVSGILGGVIFLFSNSKNIQLSPGIETLRNNNILIGIGLLIIGLVAGLFYFKRKK